MEAPQAETRDLSSAPLGSVRKATDFAEMLAVAGEVDRAAALLDKVITRYIALQDEPEGPVRPLRILARFTILKPDMRPVAQLLLDRIRALHEQAERTWSPGDPRRDDTVQLLVAAYTAAGRHDEARSTAAAAVRAVAAHKGWADASTIWTFSGPLTEMMGLRSVTPEDLSTVASLLDDARRNLADKPEILWAFADGAACDLNRSGDPRVVEWDRESHRLAVEAFGPETRQEVTSMDHLATALWRTGSAAEAAALEASALEICNRTNVQIQHQPMTPQARLGLMLAADGREDEALRTLLPACKYLREWYNPRQANLWSWLAFREFFETLATLLEKQGKTEEAKHWRSIVPPGTL